MTALFFDLGNTRIKWRHQAAAGIISYEYLEQGLGELPQWQRPGLEVVFASVVKDHRRERFLQGVKRQSALIRECRVTSRALGVTCAYSDVSRLGVDRWLVTIAAWKRYSAPVLVVDLGTAVTLDFVGRGGHHQGGYILPGLRLGIESLLTGTNSVQVTQDQLVSATRDPGRNTAEAVYNGSVAAMTATVEGSLARLQGDFPEARLLLTGGDSALIAARLQCDYEIADQLIFEGMSLMHANALTVDVSDREKQ